MRSRSFIEIVPPGGLMIAYFGGSVKAQRAGAGQWGENAGGFRGGGRRGERRGFGGDGDEADAGMAGYGTEEECVRLLENAEDGQLAVQSGEDGGGELLRARIRRAPARP